MFAGLQQIEKLEGVIKEGNSYGAQQMYKSISARYITKSFSYMGHFHVSSKTWSVEYIFRLMEIAELTIEFLFFSFLLLGKLTSFFYRYWGK